MTDQNLVVVQPGNLESWDGSAERGLQRRLQREEMIQRVLKPDLDFGIIPGTTKPSLLKPGAEKIIDALNLWPDYDRIEWTEDWNRPLFAYTYKCTLRARGSDMTVAAGIGSCNSMEKRYRWRNSERKCPKCGAAAVFKSKHGEGGWFCWAKKGGCGATFPDGDADIEGQQAGRVENEDIYSDVNTIDKQAQKRSLIAATLNLGFSEHFTQDMEPEDAQGNGKKIEQPKRRSDGKAKAETKPPANGEWTGFIEKVETKSGEKNGKVWEKFTIIGIDSEKFTTFSDTIGKQAADLRDGGEEVTIHFTTDKFGNTIESIDATGKLAVD